jgi:predicted nucleotidyltransferase
MNSIKINPKLKTILAQLQQQLKIYYGDRLVKLILFGSQARGDAQPYSDIDILVVLEGTVNPGEEIENTGQIVADLSLENDVVISCVFMDKKHFMNRATPLLRNIRKEGIIL